MVYMCGVCVGSACVVCMCVSTSVVCMCGVHVWCVCGSACVVVRGWPVGTGSLLLHGLVVGAQVTRLDNKHPYH